MCKPDNPSHSLELFLAFYFYSLQISMKWSWSVLGLRRETGVLSIFPQQQGSISMFKTQGSIIVPALFTMHSLFCFVWASYWNSTLKLSYLSSSPSFKMAASTLCAVSLFLTKCWCWEDIPPSWKQCWVPYLQIHMCLWRKSCVSSNTTFILQYFNLVPVVALAAFNVSVGCLWSK